MAGFVVDNYIDRINTQRYTIPIPGVWVYHSYHMHMKKLSSQKEKALINFKKAHSLLQKIVHMTEDGTYCIDIMQQNLAAIGLLRSAHQHLMENHLNTCFKSAMSTTNEKRRAEMTQEILTVTRLFNK